MWEILPRGKDLGNFGMENAYYYHLASFSKIGHIFTTCGLYRVHMANECNKIFLKIYKEHFSAFLNDVYEILVL